MLKTYDVWKVLGLILKGKDVPDDKKPTEKDKNPPLAPPQGGPPGEAPDSPDMGAPPGLDMSGGGGPPQLM